MKRSLITIATHLAVTAFSVIATSSVWASTGGSDDIVVTELLKLVVYLIAAIIALCIFFAPTIIAFRNHHSNRWVIAALNVAIAPTLIGWLLLFIWAKRAAHLAQGSNGTDGGESGLNLFTNDVQTFHLVAKNNSTLSAELETIEKLRARGVLTNSEFNRAKEKLIAS